MSASSHSGFTLIEVMMAAFVLTMIPIAAMIATHTICGLAREQAEDMVASSYCSDVYLYLQHMTNDALVARFPLNKTKTYKYSIPSETLARVKFGNTEQKILQRSESWGEPQLEVKGYYVPKPSNRDDYTPNLGQKILEVAIKVTWMSRNGERSFALTNVIGTTSYMDNKGPEEK